MNGNLNALEEDVKARLMVETSPCRNVNKKGETCKGRKSIQPIASAVHLFIELLNIGGISQSHYHLFLIELFV